MNPAVLHMLDHVVSSISAHLMAGTNVGLSSPTATFDAPDNPLSLSPFRLWSPMFLYLPILPTFISIIQRSFRVDETFCKK